MHSYDKYQTLLFAIPKMNQMITQPRSSFPDI